MTYQIDECPVCKTVCMAASYDYKDKKEVDCERCGKYKISLGGLSLSDIFKYKNGFTLLSYYIRNYIKPDELLTREKINSILENNQLPTYEKKYTNLMMWLGEKSNHSTKSIKGNTNNLASIIGAVDGKEVLEILDDVWGERLIEVEHPKGVNLRDYEPNLGFQARLTVEGIEKMKKGTGVKEMNKISSNLKYDIVFSFAGENRNFVDKIANCLQKSGIKYFYDEDKIDELWGKDLAIEFDNIYQREARFCIIFISKYYKNKMWTNHELKSAIARAIKEKENEYILPIRLDDTEIDGIRHTLGFIDGRIKEPQEICALILKKVKGPGEAISDGNKDSDFVLPRIKRTITDIERKKFLIKSFREIQDYFENATNKLTKTYPHAEIFFSPADQKFVLSIRVEKKLKVGCKIWVNKENFMGTSILFKETTTGLDTNDFSYNDSATVEDNGLEMYFKLLRMSFGKVPGAEDINLQKASATEVAKYFWGRIITYLNQ